MEYQFKYKEFTYQNYSVVVDEFGKNLVCAELSNPQEYLIFKQMIDSGFLNVDTGPFVVTDVQIVEFWNQQKDTLFSDLSEDDYFHILGFPPKYSEKKPCLKTSGVFSSDDYQLKIVFATNITKNGPLSPVSYLRDGLILSTKSGEQLGRLSADLCTLFIYVEHANNNWEIYSQKDRYDFLAKVKKLAAREEMYLPDFFSKTEVSNIDKVKPTINKTGEDTFEITLSFEDKNLTEQINKSLTVRNDVDSIYTVEYSGKQEKVLINDVQKEVLRDIKKAKTYNKEELKDFLENPPENWTDDIVDTSELYSDRVIGYGLYDVSKAYHFKKSIVDWFCATDQSTPKEMDRSVQIQGDQPEPEYRYTLLIKENVDTIDYESNTNELQDYYISPDIPDLKPNVELKDYQKEGIAWLYTHYIKKSPGVLFADDMGLGKTLQTLSFVHSAMAYKNRKATESSFLCLVVCPVILIENWISESEKFFDSSLTFVNGTTNRGETEAILDRQQKSIAEKKVLVISYEYLRSHQRSLAKIAFDVIILDEAQRIKSNTTLVSMAAKALKGDFKIALTGTPVENSFLDIWSLTDFALPGLLGSKKEFCSEYEISPTDDDLAIGKKGEELRSKLGSFILRRTKQDTLQDLPSKYIFERYLDMPVVQNEVYRTASDSILKVEKSTLGGRLSVLQDLKKISDHPVLFSGNTLPCAKACDSAKMIMLESVLAEIKERDEKVIIFSEFYRSQELILELVSNLYDFTPDIVNGQTCLHGRDSRQALIKRFSNKPGFNVIVMSPLAAGVGLTITAANNVINFSRHWNPAKEDQAIDRVYRIGQEKTVSVYNLICTNPSFKTFDENLDRLLTVKRAVKRVALYPSDPPNLNNVMMSFFFEDNQ